MKELLIQIETLHDFIEECNENGSICLIEKDIILQDIRNLYTSAKKIVLDTDYNSDLDDDFDNSGIVLYNSHDNEKAPESEVIDNNLEEGECYGDTAIIDTQEATEEEVAEEEEEESIEEEEESIEEEEEKITEEEEFIGEEEEEETTEEEEEKEEEEETIEEEIEEEIEEAIEEEETEESIEEDEVVEVDITEVEVVVDIDEEQIEEEEETTEPEQIEVEEIVVVEVIVAEEPIEVVVEEDEAEEPIEVVEEEEEEEEEVVVIIEDTKEERVILYKVDDDVIFYEDPEGGFRKQYINIEEDITDDLKENILESMCGGDIELYKKSITDLNQMDNPDTAIFYIQDNFPTAQNCDAAAQLANIIYDKFN